MIGIVCQTIVAVLGLVLIVGGIAYNRVTTPR
jgi:hypothetical protein